MDVNPFGEKFKFFIVSFYYFNFQHEILASGESRFGELHSGHMSCPGNMHSKTVRNFLNGRWTKSIPLTRGGRRAFNEKTDCVGHIWICHHSSEMCRLGRSLHVLFMLFAFSSGVAVSRYRAVPFGLLLSCRSHHSMDGSPAPRPESVNSQP